MNKIKYFFRLSDLNTSIKAEFMAGITTFMTLCYIFILQPGALLGYDTGTSFVDMNGIIIPKEAILLGCVLISGVTTLIMAFYTNLPLALSTGMGTNFMLGTLIQNHSISFGTAMAMVFVSGGALFILTILGLREKIAQAIPNNLKMALVSALGFFIASLGFQNSGIAVFTESGIVLGDFGTPSVYLSLFSLLLIAVFAARNKRGGVLISIIITTILSVLFGITTLPNSIVKMPDFSTMATTLGNFEWTSILKMSNLSLIFVVAFTCFFATLGTIVAISGSVGIMDQEGNLTGLRKPFLMDSLATCFGAATGNSPVVAVLESSAGVAVGGRTGLTSVVVGLLMLAMLPLSPLLLIVPGTATGPVLIYVGITMLGTIKQIDFTDFSESFGPIIMILFTIFGGGIAGGISAGILAHIVVKVSCGRHKEIPLILYITAIPLITYFLVQ